MKPSDLDNELRVLAELLGHNAPNLVGILRFGRLEGSQYYHIDMELCELNLHNYIKHEWRDIVHPLVVILGIKLAKNHSRMFGTS